MIWSKFGTKAVVAVVTVMLTAVGLAPAASAASRKATNSADREGQALHQLLTEASVLLDPPPALPIASPTTVMVTAPTVTVPTVPGVTVPTVPVTLPPVTVPPVTVPPVTVPGTAATVPGLPDVSGLVNNALAAVAAVVMAIGNAVTLLAAGLSSATTTDPASATALVASTTAALSGNAATFSQAVAGLGTNLGMILAPVITALNGSVAAL